MLQLIIFNEYEEANAESVIITFASGVRAELPTTLSAAQIKHWVDALPSAPKARSKTGRKPLPADLEREVQTHTLHAPYCDCCDSPLHAWGKEVSETLKILPQRVNVIRHERTKYACRH